MAFFLVSCCHGLHQAVRGAAAAVPCLAARHTRLAHHQPDDVTPEVLAKREERARKRAQRQSPEGLAAAAAKAAAAADAKREARRERDIREAAVLREWGIRGEDGALMPLVDIGANLGKLKDAAALTHQLQRCQMTGVSRVLVTGTSVDASRRALELVVAAAADGAEGARLFCTAGVHPHEAKGCDPSTMDSLRLLAIAATLTSNHPPLTLTLAPALTLALAPTLTLTLAPPLTVTPNQLRAPECVAVGECGLDYDRMFSTREAQLLCFERHAALAVELDLPLFLHERERDPDKGARLGSLTLTRTRTPSPNPSPDLNPNPNPNSEPNPNPNPKPNPNAPSSRNPHQVRPSVAMPTCCACSRAPGCGPSGAACTASRAARSTCATTPSAATTSVSPASSPCASAAPRCAPRCGTARCRSRS